MSTCEVKGFPGVDGSPHAAVDPPLGAQGLAPAAADLPLLVQMARYLVVGGLAFVADFGSLVLLTSLCGWYYLYSAAAAFLLGLAINYALSVTWVFKVRAVKNAHAEFLLFGLIGLVGLGINQVLLWTLTDGLGLDYSQSKLLSTPLVLAWNFGARKLLLFTTPPIASRQEMIQV
jgi:putative flippase GtrA